MKKVTKSTKKGFTLVELIVVLVILAILAAMLVPALTGYITRARQEKDYLMASTVLTAAQSAATYQYSIGKTDTVTLATEAGNGETVATLLGTNDSAKQKVVSCSFTVNNKGVITGGNTVINGYKYTYQPDDEKDMWKAEKAST